MVSITTSSFDGILYIFYPFKKSTENEKNFKRIDLKEHEISCFVKVNMQSDDELILGFGKGLVKYYKEGVTFFNK